MGVSASCAVHEKRKLRYGNRKAQRRVLRHTEYAQMLYKSRNGYGVKMEKATKKEFSLSSRGSPRCVIRWEEILL